MVAFAATAGNDKLQPGQRARAIPEPPKRAKEHTFSFMLYSCIEISQFYSIQGTMAPSFSQKQKQTTLSQLHGGVVMPSTLAYKERTSLRREDAYEYGRCVEQQHSSTMGRNYGMYRAEKGKGQNHFFIYAVLKVLLCAAAGSTTPQTRMACQCTTASPQVGGSMGRCGPHDFLPLEQNFQHA